MNQLLFLGTGTSNGVPVIGCHCPVCLSKDPKNSRLRSSVLFIKDSFHIQIDIGPDFRQQALSHKIHHLNAILVTHSHHDHIGGIDELRSINFLMKKRIPIYGNRQTLKEIKHYFSYLFKKTQKGGGKAQIDLREIKANRPFLLDKISVLPLKIIHGKLSILGYRFEDLAYITDASRIPEKSMNQLSQLKILILNSLRYRPHPTHFNLQQSLEIIEKIRPKRAYLTHLTHRFEHSRLISETPPHVQPAYDGLRIEW